MLYLQSIDHVTAMAASKRLAKELNDITSSRESILKDVVVGEADILHWTGVIYPENVPYNKGAFKIQIDFPPEYPFKPPKLTFRTKIYHPNIDEKGQICLPIVMAENWKPATKVDQVVNSLLALIHEPEPEHPLRPDLAEEYSKDRKKFNKNAEEYTKKHGLPRQ